MGFLVDSQNGGSGGLWGGLRGLVRRKQVDSANSNDSGHHKLAKELTVPYLVAIGIFSSLLCQNLIWVLLF